MNPARALARPSRTSHRRATRLAAVAVSAALTIALVPTAEAQADPTRAEAEKNVAALSKQMAIATEQYNDARENLKASKAKVAALQPRANQLQAQLGGYEAKLADFAGSAYYGGQTGAFSALLESGSPQTFMDQVAFLQYLSGNQRAELNTLLATKKEFDATKAKIDDEVTKQAAQEKVLRDKRTAVTKDLAKWQQISVRLGGGSGNVVIATYDGPASGRAREAINFAYAQLGKPYEWGAAGMGSYDCSGLTMRSWAAAGVSMAHGARKQYAAFPKVSTNALLPGDLVFYGNPTIHHVSMYVGNGKVIHAPGAGGKVHVTTVSGAGGSPVVGAVRPS